MELFGPSPTRISLTTPPRRPLLGVGVGEPELDAVEPSPRIPPIAPPRRPLLEEGVGKPDEVGLSSSPKRSLTTPPTRPLLVVAG